MQKEYTVTCAFVRACVRACVYMCVYSITATVQKERFCLKELLAQA